MKTLFAFSIFLMAITFGYGQEKVRLPEFQKFIRMDSNEPFTRDSIVVDNTQVFILFDPGCGHCQELGYNISNVLDRMAKDVDVYFVSMQPKDLVDGYINMFAPALASDSRVHFLFDPEAEFILNFNPKAFPSTYIYAKDSLTLLAHFDGDAEVDEILPLIEATTKQ